MSLVTHTPESNVVHPSGDPVRDSRYFRLRQKASGLGEISGHVWRLGKAEYPYTLSCSPVIDRGGGNYFSPVEYGPRLTDFLAEADKFSSILISQASHQRANITNLERDALEKLQATVDNIAFFPGIRIFSKRLALVTSPLYGLVVGARGELRRQLNDNRINITSDNVVLRMPREGVIELTITDLQT